MSVCLPNAVLRTQAEASLASGAVSELSIDVRDTARMLHELQVFDMELRMQNEALREALHEAEGYKAKYLDLYETAPVAYLAIRHDGTISRVNRQAAAMLTGTTSGSADVLGQTIAQFVADDSVGKLQALLGDALRGGGDFHQEELELSCRPVLPVYVNARARAYVPLGSSTLQVCLVLIDVTALRMATDDVVHQMMNLGD